MKIEQDSSGKVRVTFEGSQEAQDLHPDPSAEHSEMEVHAYDAYASERTVYPVTFVVRESDIRETTADVTARLKEPNVRANPETLERLTKLSGVLQAALLDFEAPTPSN